MGWTPIVAKRGSLTLGPGRKAYGPQLSFSSMRASASPIAGGVERQHRLMEQVVLQMLRSQLFEVAAGRYTFESYGAPQDVGHMERQWEGSRNMLGQPGNAEAHALTCYLSPRGELLSSTPFETRSVGPSFFLLDLAPNPTRRKHFSTSCCGRKMKPLWFQPPDRPHYLGIRLRMAPAG